MKLRYLVAAIILLLPIAKLARSQAIDSAIHVKEFPGLTVGAKVSAAMNTCPPHTSAPCILVLDPSLANWATGTMPTLCGNCELADFRKGMPVPDGIPGPVFNVKDSKYSAKGDGVTDDAPALQAVANACEAAGGGEIYLPAGTYVTSAMISITGSTQCSLVGAGQDLTAIKYTGAAAITAVVYRNNSGLGCCAKGGVTEDLSIAGNANATFALDLADTPVYAYVRNVGLTTGNSSGAGLNVMNATGCTFINVLVNSSVFGSGGLVPGWGIILNAVGAPSYTSNQNVFIAPTIESTTVGGIWAEKSGSNSFFNTQISGTPEPLREDGGNDLFYADLFENGNSVVNGSRNLFEGGDFSQSGAGPALTVAGSYNKFSATTIASSLTVSSGATANVFEHVGNLTVAGISDSGVATVFHDLPNSSSSPNLLFNIPNWQQSTSYGNGLGYFSGYQPISVMGSWIVHNNMVNLETIPVSGSHWMAIFIGQWSYGTGSLDSSQALETVFTEAHNTLTVGTTTYTVSTAGGRLALSTTATSYGGFSGTVLFVPEGAADGYAFNLNGTSINAGSYLLNGSPFSFPAVLKVWPAQTLCTPAASTDANCTGNFTFPSGYSFADTSYTLGLQANSSVGAFVFTTVTSKSTTGFAYTVTCTFNCGSLGTGTLSFDVTGAHQ